MSTEHTTARGAGGGSTNPPARADRLAVALERVAEIDASEPQKIRDAKRKRARQLAGQARGMRT